MEKQEGFHDPDNGQQMGDGLRLVTLPYSDTVPGPGIYRAKMTHLEEGSTATPMVVNERDIVEEPGAGTAKDAGTNNKNPGLT